MFNTYGAHNAGLLQRVKVVKGQWYTFRAWVYVWSSAQDDGRHSVQGGLYRAMVGINPWGDYNIRRDTTIWGKEIVDQCDQWYQVSVTAQAWSDYITVATRGNPQWAAKHNDSSWDDLTLEVSSEHGTCPTPTPCPACPTCPAPTPCPTCPPGGSCTCVTKEQLDAVADSIVARLIAFIRELTFGVR
jgi:hypothetical protein